MYTPAPSRTRRPGVGERRDAGGTPQACGVHLVRLWLLWGGVLVVLAGGTAIGRETGGDAKPAQASTSKRGPVTDYPSFIASLRALGAGGDPAGEVAQPFFAIPGKLIKVHGEDVQVFQYTNAAAAAAAAAPISRDGTAVGTRKIHWIGAPHFYKKDRLLVLYIGENETVLKTLKTVLGRQFAGS